MAELPILFRQQMLALLPEEADALLQALQTEPSVAVRVNLRKAMPPATDDPVAWCRSGIYLDARRQFTFDPLLHSGCYYVQDASSMFISHVLSQVAGNSPVAYLDLCAAPGGKPPLPSMLCPTALSSWQTKLTAGARRFCARTL